LHSEDPVKHPLPEKITLEGIKSGSAALTGAFLPETLKELEGRANEARGEYRAQQRRMRAEAASGMENVLIENSESSHGKVYLVTPGPRGYECAALVPTRELYFRFYRF